MDYEQLYYDSQYEIKKLKDEIKLLNQQIDIYKSLSKDKDVKSIIIEELSKYLKKGVKTNENKRN